MKKIYWFILGGLILFSMTTTATYFLVEHFKNPKVQDFKSCFEAGYPIEESYPLKCSDGKTTYVQDIIQNKDATICPLQYDPVCAQVDIVCITTPCETLYQTYANECFARGNQIIHRGPCLKNESKSKNENRS